MQTKAELMEQFIQARDQLRVLLPALDAKLEIYPGWTMKEILAHLSGWDDATIDALQTFAEGKPPLMPAARGVDFYNAQTVAERKELSYAQIVREWEWVREKLISVLAMFTEEDLAATTVAPWGTSVTVLQLLQGMIAHEEEHAKSIQAHISHPNDTPHKH